jgi:NAD(P)H dehydrogenase (quinone)
MIVLTILGHPEPGSFNHAIAWTVRETLLENKHDVVFHDLYEEKFSPLLPAIEISRDSSLEPIIDKYCAEVRMADGIVIVHPNWWGQPPAILKGWIDRILRPGVAYEFTDGDSGDGIPRGLLQAKAALVFNTSNTPLQRELAVFGAPLETLWKNCIFDLCGVKNFYRKNFEVIITSTLKQRQKWLSEVGEITNKYFPAKLA